MEWTLKSKAVMAAILMGLMGWGSWHLYQKQGQSHASKMQATMSAKGSSESFAGMTSEDACPVKDRKIVRVLAGSAKMSIFNTPEWKERAQKNCFTVVGVKSGDLEGDLAKETELDVAWPAGASAAKEFERVWGAKSPVMTANIMETAVMMGTWDKYQRWMKSAQWMEKKVTTGRSPVAIDLLKVEPLTVAVMKGLKWKDVAAEANQSGQGLKTVAINMPSVDKSNTGLLFVALAGYTLNQHEMLSTSEQAKAWGEKWVGPLGRLGLQEETLSGPWEDFVNSQGRIPMVLMYESQWLTYLWSKPSGEKAVGVYLSPGMMIKHVAVARTQVGKEWIEWMLKEDNQKALAQDGWRVKGALHEKVWEKKFDGVNFVGIKGLPDVDWASEPSNNVLETMKKTLKEGLAQ